MIIIDNTSKDPLYIQIYKQIREGIITKQLAEGDKLPSTRQLSKTLQVSRNTVDAAYLQLSSEGYIKSKKCSGFIIEKFDSDLLVNFKPHSAPKNTIDQKKIEKRTDDCLYDFQYGKMSPTDFPVKLWRKLTNQSLNTAIEQLSSYNEPKGEIGLRIEIMKYLNQYRGIRCNPEQIIICSGTQPCLNLLCQLFKNDFNHLAMEDPGYDGARYVFENLGYQVIPIDVKTDGIDITQLARTFAKLLYITPSHQFPMGCVTSIQKRLKLLDWAVKNEGIIIEDDYDSELRYSGRPIPSLQCNDFNERVVYIGTFSKSLSPALRMSYMVLPKRLLNQYNTVFTEYESSVPWLNQKTLELFMREGHWENHLRKICLSNKKKHDLLV